MEVAQFHNFTHILISFIGGILLLVIYFNVHSRFSKILLEDENYKRIDRGLLYLSLALFTWVISGIWSVLEAASWMESDFIYDMGVNLWSICNNCFFLMALVYFDEAPSFIYKNFKNIRRLIGAVISIMLVTVFVSYLAGSSTWQGMELNALPDLILSTLVALLLMYSLFQTFVHRNMKIVALLSVLSVAGLLWTQWTEILSGSSLDMTLYVLKIVSKTSLIFLFMVLATTWVIQLAYTPTVQEVQLAITDWSRIKLSIPSKNLTSRIIDFGSRTTQFQNLVKFAIRRKFGTGDQQIIRVGGRGELTSQTYLTRILDNINEEVKEELDQPLERNDLFTFLGNGSYRLRILPEHLSFEEAFLDECIRKKGFENYRELVASDRDYK